MFVIVTYDIADEKRLRKVAVLMEDYGTRVQRSVFECLIEERQIIQLIAKLMKIIEVSEDSTRIYRVCGSCEEKIQIIGKGAITSDPDVYIF
jgi:CRISPR-associated protein Cas2